MQAGPRDLGELFVDFDKSGTRAMNDRIRLHLGEQHGRFVCDREAEFLAVEDFAEIATGEFGIGVDRADEFHSLFAQDQLSGTSTDGAESVGNDAKRFAQCAGTLPQPVSEAHANSEQTQRHRFSVDVIWGFLVVLKINQFVAEAQKRLAAVVGLAPELIIAGECPHFAGELAPRRASGAVVSAR